MSKSKIVPKPIVGDDGELFQADSTVDLEIYNDYVASETYTPPTPRQRLGTFARNHVWQIIFLVFMLGLIGFLRFFPLPQRRITTPLITTNSGGFYFDLPAVGYHVDINGINVNKLRWSPDGASLAIQSGYDGLDRWYTGQLSSNNADLSGIYNFDWISSGAYYVVISRHRQQNASLALAYSTFSRDDPPIILKQPSLLSAGLPALLLASSKGLIATLSADKLAVNITDINRPDWLVIQTFKSPMRHLEWSSDGKQLLEAGDSGVWKWTLESGTSQILQGQYQHASWSPDASQIALTQEIVKKEGHFPTLTIMNVDNLAQQWLSGMYTDSRELNNFIDLDIQVEWSPDGRRIASYFQNNNVITVWEANTGRPVNNLYTQFGVTCIDWSPNGEFLAIGGAGVSIWSPS